MIGEKSDIQKVLRLNPKGLYHQAFRLSETVQVELIVNPKILAALKCFILICHISTEGRYIAACARRALAMAGY